MQKSKKGFLDTLYSPTKEVYTHILLDKKVAWKELKNNLELIDFIDEEFVLKLTTIHPKYFLQYASEVKKTDNIIESMVKTLKEDVKSDLNSFLKQK